jgi:putative transcriptional regulator
MEALKRFRHENGLSQNDMATRLGISKSFYEKIEYGDRNPSRDFLQRFKEAFPSYDMNIFFDEKPHRECIKPA